MEAVVESTSESVKPLGHQIGSDVFTEIAVECGEHVLGALERERQSGHLGHRHERAEHVAAHVHLHLVLLQHREHDVVGPELAGRVQVDLHPATGLGADVIGHCLQSDVIRAVLRLA